MNGNLVLSLIKTAAEHAERPAIKLDDVVIPYGALDQASALVAGMLAAKGIAPGDRVGIMLPNVPYFPMAYYGALRAGAVVVPMNVLLKGREVAYYLGDNGAKLLLAWHDFAQAAEAGAAQAGTEVVLVEPGKIEQVILEHEPVTE